MKSCLNEEDYYEDGFTMDKLLYFFCINIDERPFSKSLTCPILILVASFCKLCGLQKATKVLKKWSLSVAYALTSS